MDARPPCPYCGQPFTSTNPRAVYCRRQCKEAALQRRNNIAANRQGLVRTSHCGTHSGYVMHHSRGEVPCAECKAATSARSLARARARGRKPKGIAPVRPCLKCGRVSRGNFCSKKCRAEFERPCAECGEVFHPSDSQTRYCCIPCRKRHGDQLGRDRGKPWMKTYKDTPERRAHWERRQALIRGATAPGELVNRRDVFERDGWVCGLCDEPVDPALRYPDPMSVSLDHVVPVSLHGDHSMANVQCAHLFCNLSKNNRVA